ncbi:hypothetical protein ALC53_00055 [Atta colombica]|uniref:Uncharacterized protein n=1 Tax=Atta colombica TaxID=520822 RepID=A0A195BX16_9HYME|nr:hypothetical protein ALC53_00055 [Atta colombica]
MRDLDSSHARCGTPRTKVTYHIRDHVLMHHKNSDRIASDCLTSFYIFIIKFAAKTFLAFRHSHYVRAIIIFISDPNSNSQSTSFINQGRSLAKFDICSTILYMRLIAVIGAADKSKSSSEEYQFVRWPLNVARH